jgi:ATP-binding cassette subfamily B protein
LGSIAELFLPFILKFIIDDIALTKNTALIIEMCAIMLGCAVVALVGNICGNRLAVRASGNMTHDLRYDLFVKTSYLKSEQVDSLTTPSLVSRMTSDTYYVNEMTIKTMSMGIRAPILLLGGVFMTFTLDAFLALVLLIMVPFIVLVVYIVTKKSIPAFADTRLKGDSVVRRMQENVSGIRVIKALSKTQDEVKKFQGVSADLASSELRANKLTALTNPLVTIILNIGLVIVLVCGAYRSAPAGTLLAFLTYFTIIQNGILGISKIFVVLSRGIASATRVEEVLALDERQQVLPCPETLPCSDNILCPAESQNENVLEFRDVSFSYNGKRDNLSHISFAIKRGQTLGIIGATGSGKSTIIQLLLRFYDADSGTVYVNGKDVRCVEVGELRKCFGTVFQSDFLMADTVLANITYGREIAEPDLQTAIESAQAKEFIDNLPNGLQYDLAQQANNLSGGQKQRLLIARALCGNPQILVLDDSSSALDYATDAALRKTLHTHYAQTTKVIVAQRVSAIKSADLILVLDDGEMIGLGTHEELLQSCEEYNLIYQTQMGAGGEV